MSSRPLSCSGRLAKYQEPSWGWLAPPLFWPRWPPRMSFCNKSFLEQGFLPCMFTCPVTEVACTRLMSTESWLYGECTYLAEESISAFLYNHHALCWWFWALQHNIIWILIKSLPTITARLCTTIYDKFSDEKRKYAIYLLVVALSVTLISCERRAKKGKFTL